MSARVLVLGGTGMLGRAVVACLLGSDASVSATTRKVERVAAEERTFFRAFDVDRQDVGDVVGDLGRGDYVINCIGVIKTHIDDTSSSSRRNAIAINARFPYRLAEEAERRGFRVIQIATDCVYSGAAGRYVEPALHDATDVYGKTKSLGEVPSPAVLNLRCSIIGTEMKGKTSLLEWVLSHPDGSGFTGYMDHRWNGVTARAFALVSAGIIRTSNPIAGVQHLVPADEVTKDELSRVILGSFGRVGVTVTPTVTGDPIDRTLATIHEEANLRLWKDAGFSSVPTIAEMVNDLAVSVRLTREAS